MERDIVMDFDTIKLELDEQKNKLERIKEALKLDEKKERINELEKETMKDGFWEDSKNSSVVLGEMKALKNMIEKIDKLSKDLADAYAYLELAEEMNDLESYKEAKKLLDILIERLETLEIDTLLSEEYDSNNAIVTIHPGAGGTESQDWALMLYRMYSKWSR